MGETSNWYELIEDDKNIEQGDFVINCPLIIPPKDISLDKDLEPDVKEYNVIVMSQSCDIQNNKLKIVLVCPFYKLEVFSDLKTLYKKKEARENLRVGHYPGYHLLNNPNINGFDDLLVVSFRDVFGIHYEFLKNFTANHTKRLRILSPYREHLSQAFARFFMRVGLPSDIPQFSTKTVLID